MARVRLRFHDFTSADTKMRVMLGAIVWWERWLFHALHFVVSVSGVVYLVMKWGMTTDDPFALVNHPWQPGMLTIHVVAAPLFIGACGMLFRSHVLKKILTLSTHDRRSGWVSVVSFAVMALSGYCIQVASSAAAVSAAVWIHVASGVVFIVGYGVHLVIGWNTGVRDPIVPRPESEPRGALGPTGAAALLAGSLLLGGTPASASSPEPARVERTVFLMGTVATFVTEAAEREAGLARLERMVRVVEETEAELSTWRSDSALSRLNRQPIGEPLPAAPRLCALMRRAAAWRQATGGAFEPAVGRLLEVRGFRRLPGGADRDAAGAVVGLDLLAVATGPCSLTRLGDIALDAGAFGKGEALDRVREGERGSDAAWMVDLGGQVAVSGTPRRGAWTVELAHPRERRRGVAALELRSGSLSTSGGSERDRERPGADPAGHILDPRTGQTVRRSLSVVVWQEEALAADALSTALYVMGPSEGLRWAGERGLAAAFLLPRGESGEVEFRTTAAFRARFRLFPTEGARPAGAAAEPPAPAEGDRRSRR